METLRQIRRRLAIPVIHLRLPGHLLSWACAGRMDSYMQLVRPVAERELMLALALALQHRRTHESLRQAYLEMQMPRKIWRHPHPAEMLC